jgi:hypothetical protein
MSFICDKCLKPQSNHEKPYRVIVETRKRIYPKRFAKDGKTIIDNGGDGWEIAREMNLCKSCHEEGM